MSSIGRRRMAIMVMDELDGDRETPTGTFTDSRYPLLPELDWVHSRDEIYEYVP